ncbi:MAG: hypothetical protein ACOCQ4_02140, partial [bacterium]
MSNRNYIYPILLIAILISQYILIQFVTIGIYGDGVLYDGIAKAILKGQNIIDQPGLRGHGNDIGEVVMPGFPLLITFIYSIF